MRSTELLVKSIRRTLSSLKKTKQQKDKWSQECHCNNHIKVDSKICPGEKGLLFYFILFLWQYFPPFAHYEWLALFLSVRECFYTNELLLLSSWLIASAKKKIYLFVFLLFMILFDLFHQKVWRCCEWEIYWIFLLD